MRVFVDTNVILDVLARREPFYADSRRDPSGFVGAKIPVMFPNEFLESVRSV